MSSKVFDRSRYCMFLGEWTVLAFNGADGVCFQESR